MRKLHPRFYEPLCRVTMVVVEESSQVIPPLHGAIPWLVVR